MKWLALWVFFVVGDAVYSETSPNSSTAGLIGAVYTPPVPASDFILTDQQ